MYKKNRISQYEDYTHPDLLRIRPCAHQYAGAPPGAVKNQINRLEALKKRVDQRMIELMQHDFEGRIYTQEFIKVKTGQETLHKDLQTLYGYLQKKPIAQTP